MPIEFHCEHCQHHIKAPNETAGKKAKCPHCQNVVYIPMPPEESGEIPLAPIDEADERRSMAAETERRALERRLRGERSMPGEAPGRPERGATTSRPAAAGSGVRAADPRKLIVEFVAAMAEGRLADADRCAFELSEQKGAAMAALDMISADPTPPADLPKVPRPVLMGFLKQLRTRL